jgi:hypothetical protein
LKISTEKKKKRKKGMDEKKTYKGHPFDRSYPHQHDIASPEQLSIPPVNLLEKLEDTVRNWRYLPVLR